MPRISVLTLLPPVIFIGLAGLFFAGMQREDPDALPSTLVGRDAPELTITTLGDLPLPDADALAADGVKLVNFWASWCGPCRVEHPNLQALADAGIPIYGVNFKDVDANALAFLAELGNPYRATGVDGTGAIARDWGVYGVPETFVIDGQGRVVDRLAGPITQRTLEGTIRPAIAAAQSGD